MPAFLAYRRAWMYRKRESNDKALRTSSPSSDTRRGRMSTIKRLSQLLGLKRSGRRSRRQRQPTLPSSSGNKAENLRQGISASSSMAVGTSGSYGGHRAPNALGLYYVANATSFPNMSSPQLASTTTASSSFLATPTTPLPKLTLLPDHLAANPSLHVELASAKARILELEHEVKVLKATMRPVASFVDLRSKGAPRGRSDTAPSRGGECAPSVPSNPSVNTVAPGDAVDSPMRRVNSSKSKKTNRAPDEPAHHTFGHQHHATPNTFGYSSAGVASHSDLPNDRPAAQEEPTKKPTPLLTPDRPSNSPIAQSTAPTLDSRNASTPTAEIDDLLKRLSIDYSNFLPGLSSRPPTMFLSSVINNNDDRARASVRSSAGYTSPSIYSDHFSLAPMRKSTVVPSPTPSSTLQGAFEHDGNPVVDPRESRAQSNSLRLPTTDHSLKGYHLPSRPGTTSPLPVNKSEPGWKTAEKVVKPASRRLRSNVAEFDWTPPVV